MTAEIVSMRKSHNFEPFNNLSFDFKGKNLIFVSFSSVFFCLFVIDTFYLNSDSYKTLSFDPKEQSLHQVFTENLYSAMQSVVCSPSPCKSLVLVLGVMCPELAMQEICH